ncbi:hypothetical protein QQS21_007451 [Conoideocrella luteorostrata]|uniref:Ent-kaurene synthase n=1 Tax=Conoideocrella luteorostrata TaxID=1105319 RepID=A0AAJ0FXC8_9HYPO|nr:hypothetical protein QQS21_007451 [Conoideocrella luteorostrata]
MAGVEYLISDVKSLMQRALQYYDSGYGFGTMSCAPYDTAWVALVTKTVDGQKQWLFPECFEHLLATQSSSGGWTEGESTAKIDGILNTAGPLLALMRHATNPLQLNHDRQLLADRITKAKASLQSQLASWDVSVTDHVGFEIIVPAMLEYLEQEDSSLVFDYDAKAPLMKINHAKMSRFRPEYLYRNQHMTVFHSLESLIGKINFDKVSHHKTNGSMLGSPSSTAAYLMNTSNWDSEAESYLRIVIRLGDGQNSGGVPSAFPSTYFETSWMLSTLLRAGYTPAELESAELTQMTEILCQAFEQEGGVLGFAPHFEPDVDDSAKTITSLALLGQHPNPQKLVDVFEVQTHFRTYAGERDPSLTANCNALIALLQSDPSAYSSQVLKITKFLSDYWWKSDGKIKDKWNTSYLYPSVLLVESLVDVLAAIEQKKFPGVFDKESMSRLAITLFQASFRPLLDQKPNGSWNNSVEETAYGILILSESRRLHFFEDLLQPLDSAIERGVAYIKSNHNQRPNYIWIEKVSYTTPVVAQSYVLAALRAASTQHAPSIGSSVWDRSYAAGLHKHVELFAQAPLFSKLPLWELHGSMVESALFSSMIRSHRLAVFDRMDVEEDKYFDVIPFFWTSSNNRARTYVSTNFIYEMSIIALLNFQVDEFMEATAGPTFEGRFHELRDLVREMLADDRPFPIAVNKAAAPNSQVHGTNATKSVNRTNGTNHNQGQDRHHQVKALDFTNTGTVYVQIFTHLSKFINYFLRYNYSTSIIHGVNSGIHDQGQVHHNQVKALDFTNRDSGYVQVFTYLSKFLNYVLQHQWVTSASVWDQKLLRRELRTYLLAHIQQAQDSSRSTNQHEPVSTRTTTFFNWVRTTSADHISCPYSFAFISCFMGSTLTPQGGGKDCFPSAGEKYLGNAVCRHLSTMCRMYNDLGSTERDLSEGNLNSIDFPEFKSYQDMKGKQRALLTLADYERQAYMDALARLDKVRLEFVDEGMAAEAARLSSRRMAIWSMFCEEVDLYGQVYVVRDISSRMLTR